MTNIIGVDSIGDKFFEPHGIPRSLWNHAAVVGPRGQVENMIVWGNGSPNMTTIERGMDVVARPNVPQALIFSRKKKGDGKEDSDYDIVCRDVIEPTLNDIKRLYTDNFNLMTWTDKTSDPKKEEVVDMRIKTRPFVPRNKYIVFEDRDNMHVEVDKQFNRRMDDELQDNIANRILDIKAIPKWVPIGIGVIYDGWAGFRRPNDIFKIGPNTTLKLQYTQRKYARAEWVMMTSYAYIVAGFVREWRNEQPLVPGYEFEDLVALMTTLIGFISGYGSTDTEQKFNVEDVEKILAHYPGLAWSEANRYMFGGDGSKDSFEDVRTYYLFCKILGLAASRVKAVSDVMVLKKDLYINEHRIEEQMNEVFTPEMTDWGSDSTLFFPMARNNFAYGEKLDLGIPCLVDMKVSSSWTDGEKKDNAHPNQYQALEPREKISFSPVRVEHGEIPAGTVSEKETSLKGLVFTASTDARIYETMHADGMNQRTIIGLKLPLHNIVLNHMSREERIKMWLYSLFGNNEIRMKNGYVMNVSLGTFSAVNVTYRRGSMDTLIVDKKGSKMQGDQVLKPGGNLLAGPVNTSTETRATVEPAKPKEYSPDRPQLVETADGKKVPDASVASPEASKSEEKTGEKKDKE